MLTLFRRFQWVDLFVLLLIAVAFRGLALVLGIEISGTGAPGAPGATGLGPWGATLAAWVREAPMLRFSLGVLAVTVVGFVGAVMLQHYRLTAAGSVPGLVSVLVGSALLSWLGFSPALLASICVAVAGFELFEAYRHQGASLPIFNTGLWLGAAWLFSAGFVWFGLWGLVAMVQLRKVRGGDLLGMAFGFAVLPTLALVYSYAFGDLAATWTSLWRGAFVLPRLPELHSALAPLLVLGGASLVIGLAYGSLTTRRPVQEQRSSRMWFAMLLVGWLAMLLSGSADPWGVAYVLAPLSVLLGIWLAERPAKISDAVVVVAGLLIVASYVYRAVGE